MVKLDFQLSNLLLKHGAEGNHVNISFWKALVYCMAKLKTSVEWTFNKEPERGTGGVSLFSFHSAFRQQDSSVNGIDAAIIVTCLDQDSVGKWNVYNCKGDSDSLILCQACSLLNRDKHELQFGGLFQFVHAALQVPHIPFPHHLGQ